MSKVCILREIENGEFEGVTCLDENLLSVAKILESNYNTTNKVKRLINMGELQSLGTTIKTTKACSNSFDNVGSTKLYLTYQDLCMFLSFDVTIFVWKDNKWVFPQYHDGEALVSFDKLSSFL